jgi:hypothetical protein
MTFCGKPDKASTKVKSWPDNQQNSGTPGSVERDTSSRIYAPSEGVLNLQELTHRNLGVSGGD